MTRSGGDGRQVLTSLEVAAALAHPGPIELAHAEAALGTSAVRYGRDDHYDVVSAFIKSMRGSDPDAAIYWLGRMLEAGEDARFIVRRMVIFASEDVGMADPAGARRRRRRRRTPSSTSACPRPSSTWPRRASTWRRRRRATAARTAIWTVRADIAAGALGEVPAHLRDSHYQGAKVLGHGAGYEYPHDHDHDELGAWVDQQYLPDELRGRRWYRPSRHGHEGRSPSACRLAGRTGGRDDDGG